MKRWSILTVSVCLLVAFAQVPLKGQTFGIHSHNDYQRNIPFYRAYSQQVNSMEADVYVDPSSESGLLVAHDPHELDSASTIDELYIKPIVFVFAQNGGRPWKNSERTLSLMVDLKTPLHPTIDRLMAKLREYPEVFDPTVNPYAVRVIITGSRPDPKEFHTYPAFISFDGFLDVNYTDEQLKRVAFFSEPFFNYSKWKADGQALTDQDRDVIVKAVTRAHDMGKSIRFWASPDNVVAWKTLRELGVDIINTDNPEYCTLYFNHQIQ